MLVLLVAVLAPAVVADGSATDLLRLPDGFLLATATSAYQVEGAWNEDGKGESIWDNLLHRKLNFSVDCSNGDVTADSYHNYRRDVAMLRELGVDVYRFSVSWSRIMPTGDATVINPKGIAYYDALINLLLENGITPMVTMYHWDLPQCLQDLGGWANPLMARYFEEYAYVLFTKFGDRVKWWLTINEPEHVVAGYEPARTIYVPGVAPELTGHVGVASYLAAHTLLLAHGRAYRLYNTTFRQRQHGRVGLALSFVDLQPASDSPEDVEAAHRLFQFQVVPSGFRAILNKVDKEYPGYPIFITENGYADLGGLRDTDRVHYFVNYMSEMLKAVYMDNVHVIGYTYWSLMDSYEWDDGFRLKFGLYSVDFQDPDRKRHPKLSAQVFAAIAKHKHLPQWMNINSETTAKDSDQGSGAVTV